MNLEQLTAEQLIDGRDAALAAGRFAEAETLRHEMVRRMRLHDPAALTSAQQLRLAGLPADSWSVSWFTHVLGMLRSGRTEADVVKALAIRPNAKHKRALLSFAAKVAGGQ